MNKKQKTLLGLAALGSATIGASKLVELIQLAKKQQLDKEASAMILFIVFLSESNLSENDKNKVRDFRKQLKETNNKKADAFDSFIAGFLIMSTGLWNSNTNNGDAYAPYRVGIELAEKWINDLLSFKTFDEKVGFLKSENVFSEYSEKHNNPMESLTNTIKKSIENEDDKIKRAHNAPWLDFTGNTFNKIKGVTFVPLKKVYLLAFWG